MTRYRKRNVFRPQEKLGVHSAFGSSTKFYKPHDDFEEMWDTVNYGYQDPDILSGGPLTQRKIAYEYERIQVDAKRGRHRYVGNLICNIGATSTPSVVPTADQYGPELYNRMKPAEPKVDTLNALYELREIPTLLRQRYHDLDIRNQASTHLAIQFGWIPLLADIRRICTIQQFGQKYLQQLIKDNGKSVRRKRTLFENKTANSIDYTAYNVIYPTGLPSGLLANPAVINDTTITTDRVWASARFRYWLPKGPRDILWTARMLGRIYGLHIRPQVVYNAVPWTWLVDWFSGLGDSIANLDTGVAERLAADYFYVMREVKTTVHRTAASHYSAKSDGSQMVPITLSAKAHAITRSRLPGSPFGLGSDVNISPLQGSILAAIAAQGKNNRSRNALLRP